MFKAVLRRLVLPDWDALEAQFAQSDQPIAAQLHDLITVVYQRLVRNPRAHQLLRLLIAEGPRLPELTEFYHSEVIARGIGLLRALLARGVERGEIRTGAVADYPQMIMAPALMAVLWQLLFAERHPLDLADFFEAHLDLVLHGLTPRYCCPTPRRAPTALSCFPGAKQPMMPNTRFVIKCSIGHSRRAS